MRLITPVTKPPAPHQAPPARYYSLALPAWAAPRRLVLFVETAKNLNPVLL